MFEWNRHLGVRLRPYQQECLERFLELRADQRRRFHFVAPPGSGKTVLGLALLLAAGEKACVFSPNAAIQVQWAERFRDCTAEVGSDIDLEPASFGVGPEARDPFLSLTYQSLTQKERGQDRLHPNAERLGERLLEEGYRVFVFDECHHLTGHWGRVFGDLLARCPEALVVGLTATPPVDRSNRELRTYLDLVGDIVHQIPLPAVVREGNLAPYQDLVYFTRPGAGEQDVLLQVGKGLEALSDELEEVEPPLRTPALWVEQVLEDCTPGGRITPMDEWLRRDPDQVIAYVRYLGERGLAVPASVLWLDEMDDVFQVEDLVRVLQDYLAEYLEPESGGEHPLCRRIPEVLRSLGYRLVNRQFQAANVGAVRRLGFSPSKLDGLREILLAEAAAMGEDLRALVLTDYELGEAGKEGFTALDVIHLMTSDPELDALDPILVTGRSLLVDDDLTEVFLEHARRFLAERDLEAVLEVEPEQGWSRIRGRGRDWGTRAYVSLVTELLEEGHTRCLVGTRALLGEGWDSLALNTLVDLTVVASFVSVNQIRGRSIRKDPRDPVKCANNWDVVAVVPGLGYGLSDLRRLERKHEQFYGVSRDGVVEKGLGHLHPWLGKGHHRELLGRLDELNERMLSRSRERLEARDLWGIGEPYEGVDAACLELAVGPERDAPRAVTTLPALRFVDEVQLVVREHQERRPWLTTYWFLLLPPLLYFLDQLYRRWAVRRLLGAPPPEPDIREDVSRFAEVVRESLVEVELLDPRHGPECVEVSLREEGSLRVRLAGADQEATECFTEALWELMGPVQNHRYLVERRAPALDLEDLTFALLGEELGTRLVGVHPVPSLLGRNRERAQAFHRSWNRHVSPGELHYARSEEGKQLARDWFRHRGMELRRDRKQVFS